MIKKLCSLLTAALLMAAGLCLPAAAEYAEANVLYNGVPVEFAEQNAVIVDGRTLVPARGVFERMDAQVTWLPEGEMVQVVTSDTGVLLSIGSAAMAVIDNRALYEAEGVYQPDIVELDVPAQLINGKTMVPLRAVSASLGAAVEWDEATSTVSIEYTAPPDVEPTTNDKGESQVQVIKPEKNPVVTIEMEDGGKIVAELYPEIAPNTVYNFISLVQKGFYDGTIFHRVIPGFMIQGGDPQGTGTGGPGYSIRGEFSANGVQNDLKHTEGVLSMARTMAPNSAGSQFFIMAADAPHLDGQYAAFGKVTEGLDVVQKIVSAKRDMMDKPFEEQKMKKVTVETFGTEYPAPVTIQ